MFQRPFRVEEGVDKEVPALVQLEIWEEIIRLSRMTYGIDAKQVFLISREHGDVVRIERIQQTNGSEQTHVMFLDELVDSCPTEVWVVDDGNFNVLTLPEKVS